MTDLPHAKALTAEDRLRLHTHDPETFTFDISDALSLEEELDQLRDAHARALVEARQDGRREALEEAADVADQYDGEGLDGGYDCHLGDARRTQRDIAAAIRKLMEQDNGR